VKQKLFYFFSAFVTGAAVMTVEMSATRLLAPYFGTSLFVWTNVIGVIMVALALGYMWGGKMADKNPRSELYFFWILITGIWVALIPFAAPFLLPLLSSGLGTLEASLRWGSLIAVSLLVAFPMVLFGINVPFTVRLVAEKIQNIGTISGRVSMVSTVGSLIGTFLPAFILIPQLGTTKTFIFVGLVLFFLAAIGLRNYILMVLGLLGCALFWFVPPVYAAEQLIASTESSYGYVFVTQNEEGVRYLHIDNDIGVQSVYDPASVLPPQSFYYGYFGLLPALLEEPKEVLILGHAGGSFTRIFKNYYPNLKITGVELDPAVTAIAEDTMGFDPSSAEVVHGDARQYLLNTEKKFDLILVDTYHGANIPAHLATEEFFQLCQAHLQPGGLVALNAASTKGEFLDELKNSLALPFKEVVSYPIPQSFNTMLVAGDNVSEAVQGLPNDLNPFWENFQAQKNLFAYDPEATAFHDEKLSEVEVKNEVMFMRLLENF
jgi:spermidine synthase